MKSIPSPPPQAGALRTDRILGAAVLGVLYLMIVPVNGYVNMSVRIYGSRGVWSVPLFLLAGLSGTALYAALGKLLSLVRPAGSFLSYVSRSAFALLAMQFEIYDLLGRTMPTPEFASGRFEFADLHGDPCVRRRAETPAVRQETHG